MQHPNSAASMPDTEPEAILAAVEALERPLRAMSEAEWRAELARVVATAPTAALAAVRKAHRHPVNRRTTRKDTAELRAIVTRLGAAYHRRVRNPQSASKGGSAMAANSAPLKAWIVQLFEAAKLRKPNLSNKQLCGLAWRGMERGSRSNPTCSRKTLNKHITAHINDKAD